ncbi:MAG: efflux RND transporter periplasmic adaptor subunit [Microscillaceae bacterium]|nr:efflux RND transporter periplasmic adaptor subunit [Microscillaceae bacterium]MDW8460661.1 efflux RND transporter periplasmic adaptor subunit [Cytophagales bacterium]
MKKIVNLLGLVACLLWVSCETKKEVREKPVKFLVTSPLRQDTIILKEYVCQIHAINHIEMRALEKGYLQDIFVDEGKFVQKGQLMFQILPILYKAEYQKALAEANYVDIEYQNTKILADSNVISPVQLALAKAKLEKAKAELELMQVRLGFTQIRAPFSGYMNRFYVRSGSLLNEGDLLTTLSDISSLWVYFNVPEAEYLDYKKSTRSDSTLKVRLKMANHKMYEHEGIVKTIEADFNNKTGNIAFRATFPNPDALLRHGETGNIVMTVPLKQALLIPQKATFEVLDQKYVYVLDKDNRLRSRRIKIEAELPDLYVVQSGLSEQDKILLEGLRLVRENDQIKYDYLAPKKAITSLRLHAE